MTPLERQRMLNQLREERAASLAEIERRQMEHATMVEDEPDRPWRRRREREPCFAERADVAAAVGAEWEAWLEVRLTAEREALMDAIIEAVGKTLARERDLRRREVAEAIEVALARRGKLKVVPLRSTPA